MPTQSLLLWRVCGYSGCLVRHLINIKYSEAAELRVEIEDYQDVGWTVVPVWRGARRLRHGLQ